MLPDSGFECGQPCDFTDIEGTHFGTLLIKLTSGSIYESGQKADHSSEVFRPNSAESCPRSFQR